MSAWTRPRSPTRCCARPSVDADAWQHARVAAHPDYTARARPAGRRGPLGLATSSGTALAYPRAACASGSPHGRRAVVRHPGSGRIPRPRRCQPDHRLRPLGRERRARRAQREPRAHRRQAPRVPQPRLPGPRATGDLHPEPVSRRCEAGGAHVFDVDVPRQAVRLQLVIGDVPPSTRELVAHHQGGRVRGDPPGPGGSPGRTGSAVFSTFVVELPDRRRLPSDPAASRHCAS